MLMPTDMTMLFLHLLLQSAEVFLGKSVDRVVLTLPTWFTPA